MLKSSRKYLRGLLLLVVLMRGKASTKRTEKRENLHEALTKRHEHRQFKIYPLVVSVKYAESHALPLD